MSLSNLSVKQVEQAIKLLQERKVLLKKLNEIKIHLHWVIDNLPSAPKIPNNASPSIHARKRRRRYREIQPTILQALQAAGAKGLSVKELAVQTKGNEASIRTWIYTSGKKITGLRKVAPGIFAYTSSPRSFR
jgi:hypothetical protein